MQGEMNMLLEMLLKKRQEQRNRTTDELIQEMPVTDDQKQRVRALVEALMQTKDFGLPDSSGRSYY